MATVLARAQHTSSLRQAPGLAGMSAPLLTGQAGQAALGYARRGWSVIPVTPGGKRPAVPWTRWQTERPDPDQIRRWWQERPNANLGIITGAVSGLVVLDIDLGAGGFDSLAKLEAEHGALLTLEAETGHGGAHLYLKHPGVKVGNSAGKLGPGLDTRGDGGYVVAWPSCLHDGGRYTWCTGHPELEAVPAWLLDLLRPPAPPERPNRLPPGRRPPPGGPHPASHLLAARFGGILDRLAAAEVSERNHLLHWSACRLGELLDDGAPDGWIDLLAEAAQRIGLDDREIPGTINSGLRKRAR